MTEREHLEAAVAALEAQRAVLGDAVVDASLGAIRQQLAALAPPAPEQRKQVTVLFADLSGFTALAEQMDPEEVRDLMNALWSRLDAAIAAHGGTVDKHIGDAVMALFGTPTAQEDDPERAVRAALDIQAALQAFAAQAPDQPPMHMRIGLNTGPVLLGAVGSTGEYTALGDTVNVASRLEHAAPLGGILIAHATYRHVRGVFDVAAQPPLTVKGKAEPLQTYLVQRARPRSFQLSSRGIEGVATPMIGRDAELRRLQDALATVVEEQAAQALTVVADAGLGKSRLLGEFAQWLDRRPAPVGYFKGRARQETRGLPYGLVRDLFYLRFAITDSDSAAAARHKLEAGVAGVLGAEGRPAAHFLGHLLGLDFRASPHLAAILDDPRQIRDRAFGYAAQFFTAVARARPAVVLLEDLHWADDGSLDLLDFLGRVCRHVPLLLIELTRPPLYERRPAWGAGWAHHARLDLPPLSPPDSRRLAAELLGQLGGAAGPVLDLVVDRAEGNPYFVEEVIKMLLDDGVIRAGAGGGPVEMEKLAAARVPATLAGVLQARLDGLPAGERETLQRASVAGRVFWDDLVARLQEAGAGGGAGPVGPEGGATARPDATLEAQNTALGELRAKELVFRREASSFVGTTEYSFKHAVLRDVTYESVLKRWRRVYHGAVAAWLEARAGERVGEYAGRIAEHYAAAGADVVAGEWYARAGRQAQATYALETGIGYYRQALALWPADGAPQAARLEVYEGLGQMLRQQARFPEAQEIYEGMRAAAEAAGEVEAQVRAWLGLTDLLDRQGNFRAMLESAGRAEALARAAGVQPELARALMNKGWALYRLGEAGAAQALGTEALALSTAGQDRRGMANSLNLLGSVALMQGRHQQATACLEHALELWRGLGNHQHIATILANLGEITRLLGDYPQAIARYQEALAISREIQYWDVEIGVLSILGGAQAALGEYAAAEATLRLAIQRAEAAGKTGTLSEAYRFLAEALLGQGRVPEARAAAERALGLVPYADPELLGGAWRVLGRVAARGGAIVIDGVAHEAPACFAASLRIFTQAGMDGERARTLRAWAEHELERGDPARGAALWQQARTIFGRLEMDLEVARMDTQRYGKAP